MKVMPFRIIHRSGQEISVSDLKEISGSRAEIEFKAILSNFRMYGDGRLSIDVLFQRKDRTKGVMSLDLDPKEFEIEFLQPA